MITVQKLVKVKEIIVVIIAVASLVLGYLISSSKIKQTRSSDFILSYFHHLPTPLVRIISLGYDQVVADIIWIVNIQTAVFEGDPTDSQLQAIYNMSNLITDIDKTNELAYRYIATLLAYNGKIDLAEKLYIKSDHAPINSWKLNLFKARFYADFKNDQTQAIHYYYLASKQKDSPLYFPGVVSQMILDNFDKIQQHTGEFMMNEMLDLATDDSIKGKIKERITKFNKKVKEKK